MTPPSATVLVSAIDDARACMDRLEQRFRHMRVFDRVTNWDVIDVCAPHSPTTQIHVMDF